MDEQIIEDILEQLFTNGQNLKADRLLLIQESRSGAARVQDAVYLGGFSRSAVRDILKGRVDHPSASKE